eukprot:TRINITY_DN47656_c0_g1_i1.p1 TRINITY_DN47656_c0_g1~~TRINITY_DN47656_c0_g1_i1.p1  ORF type:complete len:597 (+),score=132.37 TRINITY_DN47656_c0_g1_i1:87-1877(+)
MRRGAPRVRPRRWAGCRSQRTRAEEHRHRVDSVNKELCNATTVDELLALGARHLEGDTVFGVTNLVTALQQLVQVSRSEGAAPSPTEPAFAAILHHVEDSLRLAPCSTDMDACAHVAWALATLRVAETDFWGLASAELLRRGEAGFPEPRKYVLLVWGLAQVRFWDSGVSSLVRGYITHSAAELSNDVLVRFAWAVTAAQRGVDPTAEFHTDAAQVVRAAAAVAVTRGLSDVSSSAACVLLWAACTLGGTQQEPLTGAITAQLDEELARRGAEALVAVTPRELTVSLWAVAKMHKEHGCAVLLAREVRRRKLSCFNAKHIALVLWSLSVMGMGDRVVSALAAHEILRRTARGAQGAEWQEFNSSHLALCARAAALTHDEGILGSIEQAVKWVDLNTWPLFDTSTLLWALARARRASSPVFSLAETSLTRPGSSLEGPALERENRQFVALMWAFATVRRKSDALQIVVCNSLVKNPAVLGVLSSKELVLLAWALSVDVPEATPTWCAPEPPPPAPRSPSRARVFAMIGDRLVDQGVDEVNEGDMIKVLRAYKDSSLGCEPLAAAIAAERKRRADTGAKFARMSHTLYYQRRYDMVGP